MSNIIIKKNEWYKPMTVSAYLEMPIAKVYDLCDDGKVVYMVTGGKTRKRKKILGESILKIKPRLEQVSEDVQKMNRESVSTAEAAELLKTYTRWVNKLCERGELDSCLYKGRRRVFKDSIDSYLNSHGPISTDTKDADGTETETSQADELEKQIVDLQHSLEGQSIEQQLCTLKQIWELSAKRASVKSDSEPNRDYILEILVSLTSQMHEVKKKMSDPLNVERKRQLIEEYRQLKQRHTATKSLLQTLMSKSAKEAEDAAANIPTEDESRDSVVESLRDEVEQLRHEIEALRQDVFANQKRLDCHAGRLKDVENAATINRRRLSGAANMCDEIADLIKRTIITTDTDEQN